MYYVNINIADRYPKVDAPLVITTTTEKPFWTHLRFFESDTYYDNATKARHARIEGAGKATLLAHYKVRGNKKKFIEVELVEMSLKPAPRGFFEDIWDEFRFYHEKGSSEVFAHCCKTASCHMQQAKHEVVDPRRLRCASKVDLKGTITEFVKDGKKCKAIEFTGTKLPHLRVYLELTDDETLVGFRYSMKGVADKNEAAVRARASKDPTQVMFMVRGRPYSPEPLGLAIPLVFEGLGDKHELWISEDELVREFYSSHSDYTRHTEKAFLLEIGIEYDRKAYVQPGRIKRHKSKVVSTCERHYVEYPIPYNHEDKTALIQYIVSNRAWLVGAMLGPVRIDRGDKKVMEENMLALGALLSPGKPKWWDEPAFAEIYKKAYEQGVKHRKLVRESLFTRFALAGFIPGVDNQNGETSMEPPSPDRDRMLAYEFEEYCDPKYKDYAKSDYFVEVCQYPLGHDLFPGRRWHFDEGEFGGHVGKGHRFKFDFDGTAQWIIVPNGSRVLRKVWTDSGWSAVVSFGPGGHSLRNTKKDNTVQGKKDAIAQLEEGAIVQLEVIRDSPRTPNQSVTDYRLAAYRRGRQLGRIAAQAAMAGGDKPAPKSLVDKSLLVGIDSKDTKAFYSQARNAARYERDCLMVKTFCQFGLNPFDPRKSKVAANKPKQRTQTCKKCKQSFDVASSKRKECDKCANPFDLAENGAQHREYERFKTIVTKGPYRQAAREGADLWKIREEGIRQGGVDCRRALVKSPNARFPAKATGLVPGFSEIMEEVGFFFDMSGTTHYDWPSDRAKRWTKVLTTSYPLPRRMTASPSDEFFQQHAHVGNVSPKVARDIYKQGWRSGWEKAFDMNVFIFFQKETVQTLMREALRTYVTWLLEKKNGTFLANHNWTNFDYYPEQEMLASLRDPKAYSFQEKAGVDKQAQSWSDYGTPYDHIHHHVATPAFLLLRKAAIGSWIPPQLVDDMIRDALHRLGPQIAKDVASWDPLLQTLFVSPFEILNVIVLSMWDAKYSIGALMLGPVGAIGFFFDPYFVDPEFKGHSDAYIKSRKKQSELSLFHSIPSEGSWWSVWAFSTLQVADLVFTVGAVVSGVGLLALTGRNLWNLGLRAFMGKMMRGGIQLASKNGYQMLKMGLAVGTVTGVAEEVVHAYLAEQDVSVLGMIGKSLRNSAMFCAFACAGAVLEGKLAYIFAHTATLPMSSGLAAGTMRLTDELLVQGDYDKSFKITLEMLVLVSDILVIHGGMAVGHALVRGYLWTKEGKLVRKHPAMKDMSETGHVEAPWYIRRANKTKKRSRRQSTLKVSSRGNKPPKKKFIDLEVLPMEDSLSRKDMDAIDTHPVTKKLRDRFGDGEKLHLLMRRLNRDRVVHENWGEQIQARFVARVLKHILPEATLVDGVVLVDRGTGEMQIMSGNKVKGTASKDAVADRKRLYEVESLDSAETAWLKPGEVAEIKAIDAMNKPSTEGLEMGPLKVANNLTKVPNNYRLTVRETLGVAAEDCVVSVYQQGRYAANSQSSGENIGPTNHAAKGIVHIANGVRKGKKLRVIISAAYGETLSPLAREIYKNAWPEAKFYRTSELSSVNDLSDVAVIFNDTRGRMTHVHAASDLVVVQGAVNPVEGLRAGTATLHLLEKGEPYDANTLAFFEEAGRKSGAFEQRRGVIDIKEIVATAKQLIGKTPKPFAHEKLSNGESPYTTFLNNLDHYTNHWDELTPRMAYIDQSLDTVRTTFAQPGEFDHAGYRWRICRPNKKFKEASQTTELYVENDGTWLKVGSMMFTKNGDGSKLKPRFLEEHGKAYELDLEHVVAERFFEGGE